MNNSEGETRLCRKCGKRLPSSNNFCMYCGYNNNLNDEELEALKAINANNIHTQNKQELLNKSIAAKDRELIIGGKGSSNTKIEEGSDSHNVKSRPKSKPMSLMTKLLYVFIIIDIIIVSGVFLFKSDGLLFEKFKYNLDGYDKLIYLDEDNYLGLKDNKLVVVGKDVDKQNDKLETINKEKVLGMIENDESYEDNIYVETNENFYTLSSSSITNLSYVSIKKEENSKPTDNFYKDINTNLLDKTNINGDYYNVLGQNYFIKNNSLYKNVPDDKNKDNDRILKSSYYYSKINTFYSEKVLDDLNMKNPEIVYTSSSGESIIIKGDDSVKVFVNGKMVHSFDKITSKGRTFNISDFKYVLARNGKFLFVRNNGASINYSYDTDILRDAEFYGSKLSGFLNKYSDRLTSNVDVDKVYESSLSLFMEKDSFSSLFSIENLKNPKSYLVYLLILVPIALLLYELYRFREASFVVATLYTTVTLVSIYAVLQIGMAVLFGLKSFNILNFIKSLFTSIPGMFVVSWFLIQIRSIVNYISFKLNIETIYHFILLTIGVFSFLVAVSMLTNNIVFVLAMPGMVYVFMTLNDESYVEYNTDSNMLIKIIATLFISFVLGYILCVVFSLCQYYLFIMVVAFSLGCFMVMYEDINIVSYIKRTILSFSMVYLTIAFFMVSGLVTILEYMFKIGFSGLGEYFKLYMLLSLVLAIYVTFLCAVFAAAMFGIKKASKIITDKIDNRILQIFIFMVIMVILTVIFMLVLPYLNKIFFEILDKLFKVGSYIDSFSLTSLF